jgi:hypothetical protein
MTTPFSVKRVAITLSQATSFLARLDGPQEEVAQDPARFDVPLHDGDVDSTKHLTPRRREMRALQLATVRYESAWYAWGESNARLSD